MSERRRSLAVAKEMRWCRHFRGTQHKLCEAGVAFDSFRREGQRLALPCLKEEAALPCSLVSFPSREEAERTVDEQERRIAEFLRKTNLGICGACGQESTDWVQNGPCIYSQPCGHRVGQGDAKKYKAGVLAARATSRDRKDTP